MRPGLNSHAGGGGMRTFKAAGRVIRVLACGSGLVLIWSIRIVQKVQVCRKSAGTVAVAGRILRGAGLLAGVALLAGCAGKVGPDIQYVRVEVPVQVPCRAPEVAIPPWAAASLRKTDSLEMKVRALLAERRQRIGYERQLQAAVQSCR